MKSLYFIIITLIIIPITGCGNREIPSECSGELLLISQLEYGYGLKQITYNSHNYCQSFFSNLQFSSGSTKTTLISEPDYIQRATSPDITIPLILPTKIDYLESTYIVPSEFIPKPSFKFTMTRL